jgi:serine/threonine protein phosphatase PrpC
LSQDKEKAFLQTQQINDFAQFDNGRLSMKYLYNGISLQNGRKSNMDSLFLKHGSIGKKNALLSVVCDGVGSLADGAFSSRAAIQMLNEWFSNTASIDCIGLSMRDAILAINTRIIFEAKEKDMDTASTLSALLLVENRYYIAHIGDSRIYCCQGETLSILTRDDVSKSGKLTAYIGRIENIFIQYAEGLAVGKTFLVCSDGLYKRMDMDFLITKMKSFCRQSLDEAVEDLPQYVIEHGEQDNISLALARIEN